MRRGCTSFPRIQNGSPQTFGESLLTDVRHTIARGEANLAPGAGEMGLFDTLCGLTGIALNYGPCCLVVLRQVGDGYVPVSLPIWGVYDGYGSVEDVDDRPSTTAFVESLEELRMSRRLTVNERLVQLPDQFRSAGDAVKLLCDGGANLSCDGDALAYSLLHGRSVQEIGRDGRQQSEGLRLDVEPARSAYAHQAARFASELKLLARVDYAMEQGLGWKLCETGQYSDEEAREFLAQARSRYVADSGMLQVLNDYADWRFEG